MTSEVIDLTPGAAEFARHRGADGPRQSGQRERIMSFIATLTLRQILCADAISSGAMGLLLLLGAGVLEPLLEIPADFQRAAGLILLPFAAFAGWLASRVAPPRRLVWMVVVINIIWAGGSLLTLAAGVLSPTALGLSFVIAQAIAVGVLAELQIVSLRRSAPVGAAEGSGRA